MRMQALRWAMRSSLLAGCLVASAVQAAPDRSAVAEEVFYDFCLEYLNGNEALTQNKRLTALGFSTEAQSREHPVHGTISVLEQGTDEVGMAVGGAPETICILIITGGDRLSVKDHLQAGLVELELDFKRTDDVVSPSPMIAIDTYKAKLEEGVLVGVSFMTVDESAPNPSFIATIYFQAE